VLSNHLTGLVYRHRRIPAQGNALWAAVDLSIQDEALAAGVGNAKR
jgi:hypothetical protein